MSGGVDSSVAAAILKDQGYDVLGATMKIWPREDCGRHKARTCCSLRDIEDARRVCDILDVRHYTLDLEKFFREKVIDYFVREYMAGRTPNPCIVCNEKVKFGRLLEKALSLECDFIATGHYAVIERKGRIRLKESEDKTKDQSYVLSLLTADQLKSALFPLGDSKKTEVRKKARALGLSVHEKPDSQEICFVPGDDYSKFIRGYCGIEETLGDIVDISGRVLGRHKGFWNFTIGQRRGLGISYKEPLYVINIIPDKNLIVVAPGSETKRKKFTVKDINWICKKNVGEFDAEVKVRYAHKKSAARVKVTRDFNAEVEFKEPQAAITPGQAAVFYKGEYVSGGGWIEKVM